MRPVIGPDGNIVNPAGFWATYNQVFPNISKGPPGPKPTWTPGPLPVSPAQHLDAGTFHALPWNMIGALPPGPRPNLSGQAQALPLQLLAALAAQMWASSGMPAPGTLGGLNVGSGPGPRPGQPPGGGIPPRPGGGRPMDPRVAAWLAGGGIR